jgi:hypothetical protein
MTRTCFPTQVLSFRNGYHGSRRYNQVLVGKTDKGLGSVRVRHKHELLTFFSHRDPRL